MQRKLPAYPLFVKDPYFSFYLAGEFLNIDPITFWSGQPKTILGYIKIDGILYNFLGNGKGAKLVQTGIHVSTFATTFTFDHDGDTFSVNFVSPLPLDDLDVLALPITYLSYTYESLKTRTIEVSLIIGEDVLYNAESKANLHGIKGSGFAFKNYELVSFRTRRQNYLSHTDDEKLADHGSYYLSGEKAIMLDEKSLNSYLDGNFVHTYTGENKYLFASVTGTKGFLALGRDEVVSLQYFDELIIPYYKQNGQTIFDAFNYFYLNFAAIENALDKFSEKLEQDALNISPFYKDIVVASYRQSIAAHKLGKTHEGKLLFISKECSSNGCAATADVSYPSMPLYLLYNPELVNAMLRPIFSFAKMPVWEYPFAPHDAGRFPLLIGQVYGLTKRNDRFLYGGDDRQSLETESLIYTYPKGQNIYDLEWQMPIEESANMIIMTYSAYHYCGDTSLILENYDLLVVWAKYLVKHGYIPENQICTDDFAGHLDKHVNLTIKATVAMRAFLEMAKLKNDTALVSEFEKAIDKFVLLLETVSKEHGYLPLTFNEGDTRFSLKYNLAIDKLLHFNLFSKALYDRELRVYYNKLEENGVRLDPRHAYAKADWQLWVASFADDNLADEIYKRIVHYLQTASERWPFPDWFDANSSTVHMFRNRSVVGGNFMPLLLKSKLKAR